MDNIDFFFDPICPWAWVTSRWVMGLKDQGVLNVNWRFISLKVVNAGRNYELEFPSEYTQIHGFGHSMLRVAAMARHRGGNEAVETFYTAIGKIHTRGRSRELVSGESIADIVLQAGLETSLLGAFDDQSWDPVISAETEMALSRTGREVGTPIITFNPPEGPSLFGPVMSSIPRGADALELYGAYRTFASRSDFYELKRAIRKAPSFE